MIMNRSWNLLRNALLPNLVIKRNWAQVGQIVCTPPRVKVSWGEKVLHILFMYVVWFVPLFYSHTNLKIWRRRYIT
ncbi:unnamed protein product [Arctia plantaginis]|uniref:Uncharacterized protein n=1 Tax=Arctia plantaginis TaxID=874455 RepID=A0A8S0ZJ04_ARCPL|nr:unnamed protein product [Arctia plantaginis]CAB3258548.1 unnamed protein product [Arctia plantaginis]